MLPLVPAFCQYHKGEKQGNLSLQGVAGLMDQTVINHNCLKRLTLSRKYTMIYPIDNFITKANNQHTLKLIKMFGEQFQPKGLFLTNSHFFS